MEVARMTSRGRIWQLTAVEMSQALNATTCPALIFFWVKLSLQYSRIARCFTVLANNFSRHEA